ncbi:hypothetical protein SAMN02745166_05050 [Prosthecobacter debontii]|uniref:Uncharacterized protein n=1 Tax=Prosthecobacter debontii TaxID=48467 RepID=A0A1T4Z4T0_9BACT|nr:hypothetical protein SAMN02745166_05050 [Prosthecobacter debontii]
MNKQHLESITQQHFHKWTEEDIKVAYRHMRIQHRCLSRAVRNLVLQECLTDLDPKVGTQKLIEAIDDRLKLT